MPIMKGMRKLTMSLAVMGLALTAVWYPSRPRQTKKGRPLRVSPLETQHLHCGGRR